MDATDFERLIERARDPRLIAGIYNYCDGRCPRCSFTQRCLMYLDVEALKAEGGDDRPLAETVGDSLQRTLEMLAEVARRQGLDMEALAEDAREAAADDALERQRLERHSEDPLVLQAREYGRLAWRVGR